MKAHSNTQAPHEKTMEKVKNTAQKEAEKETSPAPVRRRRVILFQFGLLAVIAAFSILTILVRKTAYFSYDLQITHTLQTINNPLISGLLKIISWAGDAPQAFIIPLIIILLLYASGLHWEALASLAAAVLVSVLNVMLKVAIHRPRPAADLVHVTSNFGSYSFPSGHVMFYTGFFTFICFLAYTLLKPSLKRTFLIALFGIHVLLVGASRIYLGAHWFSDVIGAYLIGFVALIGFITLYRWGKTRFFVHQPVAKENKSAMGTR
jgi:membrane-associated phospholipid phosphatase